MPFDADDFAGPAPDVDDTAGKGCADERALEFRLEARHASSGCADARLRDTGRGTSRLARRHTGIRITLGLLGVLARSQSTAQQVLLALRALGRNVGEHARLVREADGCGGIALRGLELGSCFDDAAARQRRGIDLGEQLASRHVRAAVDQQFAQDRARHRVGRRGGRDADDATVRFDATEGRNSPCASHRLHGGVRPCRHGQCGLEPDCARDHRQHSSTRGPPDPD